MYSDEEQEKRNADFWKSEARFNTFVLLLTVSVTFMLSTTLMLPFITSFSNVYIHYVILAVSSYFAIRIIHKNYTAVLAGNLTSVQTGEKIRTIIISVVTILTLASIIYGAQHFQIKPSSNYYGYH